MGAERSGDRAIIVKLRAHTSKSHPTKTQRSESVEKWWRGGARIRVRNYQNGNEVERSETQCRAGNVEKSEAVTLEKCQSVSGGKLEKVNRLARNERAEE